MVVLDTCAIVELCKDKVTFLPKTLRLIDSGCFILTISFAEIACKVQLGKLEMDITIRDLHQAFTEIEAVKLVDIGVDEWLDSIELAWPQNKDPADRMLTAFAMKRKIPLITSDQKIKKFYNKTLW